MSKPVTQYWLKHYINGTGPEGRCSLCGNSGKIDTRSTAFDARGVSFGRINFCICPNGQQLRHRDEAKLDPVQYHVGRVYESADYQPVKIVEEQQHEDGRQVKGDDGFWRWDCDGWRGRCVSSAVPVVDRRNLRVPASLSAMDTGPR